MSSEEVPFGRVHRLALARRRYPDLVDSHLPALVRGDAAADRVIKALGNSSPTGALRAAWEGRRKALPEVVELLDSARKVPPWLELPRLEKAGKIFFRAGVFGGLTLALRSLVLGYAAPAGNKALVFSGRLNKDADRRLAETAHFARSVCQPGGMLAEGEGFWIALHVRLMHAKVRDLAQADPRWKGSSWGTPINQHDMLATILLFSCVFVEGIRSFGIEVTPREADDFQHLYRFIGVVMGVEERLLPRDFREAQRMAEFIDLTQGPPDCDARNLVRVLMRGPLRGQQEEDSRAAALHRKVVAGLCRALLGDERADQLGIPRSATRHLLGAAACAVRGLEVLRCRFALDSFVEDLGNWYWEQSVQRGLRGIRASYRAPLRLTPLVVR